MSEKTHEKSEMYLAADLVNHPQKIDAIAERYALVLDQTTIGPKFKDIAEAVNLMAGKGWNCLNISVTAETTGTKGLTVLLMYALMEKKG